MGRLPPVVLEFLRFYPQPSPFLFLKPLFGQTAAAVPTLRRQRSTPQDPAQFFNILDRADNPEL